MNYGSYNDPVRYTPPARLPRPRMDYRPWLIGCGGCVVICALLIGWMVFSVSRMVEDFRPDVREARVISGEQLAWRELAYHPANMLIVGVYMRTLDANGDGQRELIFIDTNAGTAELVDLQGNVTSRHSWTEWLDNDNLDFWDFNGDDVDEVLVFDWEDTRATIRCRDLDFRELHVFQDWTLPSGRASADFNGDGDQELLLVSPDGDRFAVFDQQARELFSRDNPATREGYWSCPVLWADMDGDGTMSVLYGQGLDRYILQADGSREGFGVQQNEMLEYGYDFWLAMDLSGDGISDLLNWDDEYYDGASGAVVALRNPADTSRFYSRSVRRPFAVFDFDSDGVREICNVPGGEDGTELVIYAPAGNVEYHEALAKFCGGMEVITENGVEHLVVCAFDKVLVFP